MWRTLITSYYKKLIDSVTNLLTLYHLWFIYSLYSLQLSYGIKNKKDNRNNSRVDKA